MYRSTTRNFLKINTAWLAMLVMPNLAAADDSLARANTIPVETDMHEFMEYYFQPTFGRLKLAMAEAPNEKKTWKTIKADSLILAEGGNLLLSHAPETDRSDWIKQSELVRRFAGELYQAGKRKDYEVAVKYYVGMVDNCNACHQQFAGGEHILSTGLSDAIESNARTSKVENLRRSVVDRAFAFMSNEGQSARGTFSEEVGPGVTALALTGALRNGRGTDDPMVAEGLKALEGFIKPDGGIYGNGRLRNYETCVAMVCLSEANKNGQYNETLKRAKAFVTGLQFGDAKRDESDPWYGGVGYGGEGRPDLSNTAYLIEALRSLETGPDDSSIQAALQFVSRCQNLQSVHNETQFADKVNDGGFYYEIPTTKIDPSTSQERFTPNGGLRSYGSMGYAGLKSMIFAGLTPEDPRVKAALKWITDHYDIESNPGMGSAGLYYYYHTFAAALATAGVDKLRDADGVEHDWRADLVNELAKQQAEDGSWSNENQRWFENDKNLATAFALMALSYCEPPVASAATSGSNTKAPK